MNINQKLDVIIPIRIDSTERLENLITVIEYYEKLDIINNIILGEDDKENKISNLGNYKKVKHFFFHDDSRIFHRTAVQNKIAIKVETDYFIMQESDVFVTEKQLFDSIDKLENGYDAVLPYNGLCIDLNRQAINSIKSNNFTILDHYKIKNRTTDNSSVGGILIMKKDSYLRIGGDNEKMISWGFEDYERFTRFNIMGMKTVKLEGVLYHIDHPRNHNSGSSNPHLEHNKQEYFRVMKMNKNSLELYINSNKNYFIQKYL